MSMQSSINQLIGSIMGSTIAVSKGLSKGKENSVKTPSVNTDSSDLDKLKREIALSRTKEKILNEIKKKEELDNLRETILNPTRNMNTTKTFLRSEGDNIG